MLVCPTLFDIMENCVSASEIIYTKKDLKEWYYSFIEFSKGRWYKFAF